MKLIERLQWCKNKLSTFVQEIDYINSRVEFTIPNSDILIELQKEKNND